MINPERTPEALKARFELFAEACNPSSPLYYALSLAIAQDADLLALASQCRADQPAPNLFFAAVHFLLLWDKQHPLAGFYPSLSGESHAPDGAFPHFREFCLEKRGEIIPLLRTRLVQTNEVRRSTFLYPAFSYINGLVQGSPLALVEIGASAGLNLNWDKYSYAYGEKNTRGNPQSPVKLETAIEGTKLPPTPEVFPEIASRLGLELHPIQLENNEELLWLEALVWPEHQDRIDLLHAALEVWKTHPQEIIGGDAVETLPEVVSSMPDDSPLVIYHSMALYQFPPEKQKEFKQMLTDLGNERSLFHLSAEWDGIRQIEIRLTDFTRAKPQEIHLANSEGHARWLEWLVE